MPERELAVRPRDSLIRGCRAVTLAYYCDWRSSVAEDRVTVDGGLAFLASLRSRCKVTPESIENTPSAKYTAPQWLWIPVYATPDRNNRPTTTYNAGKAAYRDEGSHILAFETDRLLAIDLG